MAGLAIITEACIDVKDRACVDVCPVQCIYELVRRSSVVFGIGTAAVLPVAADRGVGAGQPPVDEEVAADALHRRGFARRPHPGAWGEVRAADDGDRRNRGAQNRMEALGAARGTGDPRSWGFPRMRARRIPSGITRVPFGRLPLPLPPSAGNVGTDRPTDTTDRERLGGVPVNRYD